MFIQGSYKVCSAEIPVSKDPERSVVDLAAVYPARVCGAFSPHTKMTFFRCAFGFVSAPDKMLLSVFIATDQATYPKTAQTLD